MYLIDINICIATKYLVQGDRSRRPFHHGANLFYSLPILFHELRTEHKVLAQPTQQFMQINEEPILLTT